MSRWKVVAGVVVAGMLSTGLALGVSSGASAGPAEPSVPAGSGNGSVRLFATNPTLVRAGERVSIPVDAVCATARHRVCSAVVRFSERNAAGAWHSASAPSSTMLRFDLSAPASRAAANASGGAVEYAVGASGGGTNATLGRAAAPLRFYVVPSMPVVRVPQVPFGQVRTGRTVLYLPWGSGPNAAGLIAPDESAGEGPSAFDVGRDGSITLLDPVQDRMGVWRSGKRLRSVHLPLTGRADVSVTPSGRAFVLDLSGASRTVRSVDGEGRVATVADLGNDLGSEIRTTGEQPFVLREPLDAWTPLGPGAPMSIGQPSGGGGQLLRIATESSVRLGLLSGGTVRNPVELRSADRFGEIALAEADGTGGYLAVLHMWREGSNAADQYQVVRVFGHAVTESFAIADLHIVGGLPLSRFRLGPDGNLYALTAASDGARVVRFDLRGGAR